MANYESVEGIQEVITAPDSGLSQTTVDAINGLLQELTNSVGAAAAVEATAVVDQSVNSASEIAADKQIVLMGEGTTLKAEFTADSNVKAVVLGSGDNNTVSFATSEDVTVQLGGGQGDSVATGEGSDNITFAGGSATIDTGLGNDTVILTGEGTAHVKSSGGQLVVDLQTDSASASIEAGDGFDRVNLAGDVASRIFEFLGNGIFRMAQRLMGRAGEDGATPAVDMANVNVVTFSDDAGTPEHLTVLANSESDGLVTSLYQVVLGRQAIDAGTSADQMLGGINFWTTDFDGKGYSLEQTTDSFMGCAEIVSKLAGKSVEAQVQMFFDNLGAANGTTVSTVNGFTAADFAGQVNSGAMTLNQVAQQIALSGEAVQILGQDGAAYFVDGFSDGTVA